MELNSPLGVFKAYSKFWILQKATTNVIKRKQKALFVLKSVDFPVFVA
ncbi:MAG: hypothetical protein IJ909_02900 [Fibrobacter sp.]|nr:hypothetical protein [Fibrobacter sp.]